ncbi:MAG TPA: APC family permease [Phycisphaerales bacterium]|nr:APC family permease [Phycisphaerales bacterium]
MASLQPGSDTSRAVGARGKDAPLSKRVRRALIGPPRPLDDKGLFHKVTLVAVLAWIGLGADGLSSSAYGPEEAFRTLGAHTYLAIGLAVVMAATVIVISIAYSRVIEHFPHGGGGYVVATKLLGERAGLVSGSALLVDYVLTITISIAAAGDALFSFVPIEWHSLKLPIEVLLVVGMIVLNLRGVRESVLVLAPIFFLFVITHFVLIFIGIGVQRDHLVQTVSEASRDCRAGLATLGVGGMALLFTHAYSLGGGTYTGIEAVSNGLAIMRAPRVATGKRTMAYMAASLAFTASGLLLCYLIWNVSPVAGKTMNAVLAERFVERVPLGSGFVVLTMLAEGAILVVAAQAGFMDGPRVLANMAVDSWVPRRCAALSERLTTQNGIVLMGLAALAALIATRGDVRYLVVMYSINVFLTFSMTETSMCRFWIGERRQRRDWWHKIGIHAVGLAMCATILCITVIEKFSEGGWITLTITVGVVGICLLVRRHYTSVARTLERAFEGLEKIPEDAPFVAGQPDPSLPVAVVLVGGFNGFGVHTTLNVFRAFPQHFKGVVFASVGVIDSGVFKGEGSMEALRERTAAALDDYARIGRRLGIACTTRVVIGTDAVEEGEKLCLAIAAEFSRPTFFAGQVIFGREAWYHRLLHNQTAYALQRRLQLAGLSTVILPARVSN